MSSPAVASVPKGPMLWANCHKSLVMIPRRKDSSAPLQVPQSPLMAEAASSQNQNRSRKKSFGIGRENKTSGTLGFNEGMPRPLTPKITRNKPLKGFYWGNKVTEGMVLSERMSSLQRVMGLNYCKSVNPGATACKLHCLWAKYLREDVGDDESAVEFYRFSADMGHARSMYKLACMSLLGQGLQSSPRLAMIYFRRLINSECDHICVTWRACSASLNVQSPGQTKSAKVVKQAIDRLCKSALKGLDYHYASPWGEVLDIDDDETKMGFSQATLMLGRLYLRASFVGQNIGEAMKWLVASSKLGNTDAMCTIGDCFTYNHAGSIPQNVELARKYYAIAAHLGHSKSKRRLESLRDWE